MKKIILLALTFCTHSSSAQIGNGIGAASENTEEKAYRAIDFMEAGQIAESIALLEECQNLDPDNMTYPYEIAFAHYLGQDFSTAAKALKKLTSHKDVTDLVYQMLGNSYDLLGKPEKDFEDFAVWLSKNPLILDENNGVHSKSY